MTEHGLPALYALFVWWFSTGLVLYLHGLARRTFRRTLLTASLLLAGALTGVVISAWDGSAFGAYLGFSCGLLVWGWHELSYFTGLITGPRRLPCPPGCRGRRRFLLALQTSLYHELAVVFTAAALAALTWQAPNQTAVWTFAVLWWMRWSAKLNIFLGVSNLHHDWFPEHLRFLSSYAANRPLNALFPVSVSTATVAAVLLAVQAAGASGGAAVGLSLVTALLALAILEHWFLVLPLGDAALWRWAAPRTATDRAATRTAPS